MFALQLSLNATACSFLCSSRWTVPKRYLTKTLCLDPWSPCNWQLKKITRVYLNSCNFVPRLNPRLTYQHTFSRFPNFFCRISHLIALKHETPTASSQFICGALSGINFNKHSSDNVQLSSSLAAVVLRLYPSTHMHMLINSWCGRFL